MRRLGALRCGERAGLRARSVFLNNLPVEASSEWIKTTVLGVLPEGSNDPAVIERVYIGRDRKCRSSGSTVVHSTCAPEVKCACRIE